MALQTTVDIFQTRFALPLELLRQVLRDCGLSSGSLESLDAFAAGVDAPGCLADSVAATLRTVMYDERSTLTRLDMLELLCIAVSGSDVESSGPAFRRSLRQMLVFVNGVMLSLQEAHPRKAGKLNAEEREWPQNAEAVKEQEKAVEPQPEIPENFYVLESFNFPPHGTFAPPAVFIARTDAASCAAAPEQALEPTKEKKPEARWVDEAAAGVIAQTSITAQMSSAAAPADREEPATSGAESVDAGPTAAAKFRSWLEGTEIQSDAVPGMKATAILSQPALIACALVLGFGGGMLVPRFSPKKAAFQHSSERPNASPQRVSAKDAALDAAVDTAATDAAAVRLAGMLGPSPGRGPAGVENASVKIEDAKGHAASRIPLRTSGAALLSVPADRALANLFYSPQPLYPTLAQLTHVEGGVVLAIAVSAQGTVVATRVVQGQPLLRGAAETAVRHWRFRPFVEDGRPTQVQTSVVVDVRPPL